MKLATAAVLSMVLLDHAHLVFPAGFDYQNMILFRDILILLLAVCAFRQTPRSEINTRSVYAVGIVFATVSVGYFCLWWAFDMNTLWVYPVSLGACLGLFFYNARKNYEYRSDMIVDGNVYICFWKPKDARTIFPSLVGAAIGSVAVYAGGHRYSFKWGSDRFKKRQVLPKIIEREYIVVDTGVGFSQPIERELKKLNECRACILGIKFLRFKCVYAVRNVLKAIGKDFTPSFFEFIPALYALKILRWRYDRKR